MMPISEIMYYAFWATVGYTATKATLNICTALLGNWWDGVMKGVHKRDMARAEKKAAKWMAENPVEDDHLYHGPGRGEFFNMRKKDKC